MVFNRLKTILVLEIGIHLLVWMLFFLSINVAWGETWIKSAFLPVSVAPHFALIAPSLFYTNSLYLLPTYFTKRKWPFYFTLLLSGLLLVEGIRSSIFTYYLHDFSWQSFYTEYTSQNSFLFSPLIAIISAAYFTSCLYFFVKGYIKNQLKVKQLAKENAQIQLSALKAQFDPHFLFNNLNALDSLIVKDPTRAQHYLQQLSQLYRYNVEIADRDLVYLEEEFAFAEAYTHLIKERYDNLYLFSFGNQLDQHGLNYKLPPGSLQTVLENVIKHNKATVLAPLKTEIKIEDDYLVVKNNKNVYGKRKETTKSGLAVLASKLAYFNDKQLIVNDSDFFEVKIPLILTG